MPLVDDPTIDLPDLGERSALPSIEGYTLRELLGEGGFSHVYRAERHHDRRDVAIKILKRHLSYETRFRQRFLAEVGTTQALDHPNIVEVLGGGLTADGCPYIVMEHLVGGTLTSLISTHGRFDPPSALAILEPVCAALEFAHANGIVHRDVKAANVMLLGPADRPHVKLLDFGVAKALTPSVENLRLTATGVKIGSPTVMAPEQIRCQAVDARTDVYALGVLLYRLVVGSEPFRGERTEIEHMHLSQPAPRPSLRAPVPPSIDDIVLKAMEKAPARRYPSVRAFVEALRTALGHQVAQGGEVPAEALVCCVQSTVPSALLDDEQVQDDLLSALERVEAVLRAAGLAIALDTGNGFVAAQVFTDDPTERTRQCAAVAAAVRAVQAALVTMPWPHGGQPLRIGLHVDRFPTRSGDDGARVIEVSLANAHDWIHPAASGTFLGESCRVRLDPNLFELLAQLPRA